ncbi:oxysterol-binding protein-related protein 6-like isoform X2 [Asterias rubens]|uniref:oxysterol-binding protein-related protein 6-like isoform X2 n=1 Tax=Asterias rubens TaxID=7604 RepID=UPI0014556136|nr:oxysterol-binding protein-related protein 6-like isoform X2 [Asterias rubens]
MEDADTKERRQRLQQQSKRNSQPADMEPITETNSLSLPSSTGTTALDEPDKKSPKLLPLNLQKAGETVAKEPGKIEGYLLKRRKRPMKGWHKRYFVLEKGMLTYGKNCGELMKGKIHGTIDVLAAVISTEKEGDKKARRIDIDTEEFLYHVKATSHDEFLAWHNHLHLHQSYRKQIQLAQEMLGERPAHPAASPTSEITLKAMTLERRRLSLRKQMSRYRLPGHSSSQGSGSWKNEISELDKCSKELTEAENSIVTLSNILQDLLNQELPFPYGNQEPEVDDIAGQKRSKGKLSLRKSKAKKSSSDTSVVDTRRSSNTSSSIQSNSTYGNDTMHSIASSKQLQEDSNPRDDFMDMANQVHRILKSVLHLLSVQHDRLRYVIEAQNSAGGAASQSRQISILQEALTKARSQNEDMRGRLGRIFNESNIQDLSPPVKSDSDLLGGGVLETLLTKLKRSMSGDLDDGMMTAKPYSMSPQLSEDREMSRSESLMEFYDALDYAASTSASSSEDEEEIESSSLASEEEVEMREEDFLELEEDDSEGLKKSQTGRRTQLPAPQPDTSGLSLWNILKKNIGKDLSKIAMPVALNEPLSMLQVLAEELEYSELLDKAAETDDPYKRMVYVASFAVSSYASTYYRAGTKPFNPLLGETYECVREDKGFRFMAEQVSHHPPVSACHCESKNFIYTQDARIKTKFWGKSMEIIPAGNVNIKIPRYNDHYKYNKVTSCVHNILSGERWLDHYGESLITNGRIVCKLTFTKASYWSNRRHEVHGVITEDGQVIHELFGKWNEGIYCGRSASAKCIWRTGSMPENHRMYYGFTRFAIELNELDPNTKHLLPPTDGRLRPDQRKLEDGDVMGAEREKQRLESLQRERRKWREEQGNSYEPRFFRLAKENGKEVCVFKGDYWDLRRDPGFKHLTCTELW